MSTLADEYPKQQDRLRTLIGQYESLRGMPGVNVEFALAMLHDVARRADQAAMSGDVVEMLRMYKEMEGCE